MRACRLLALILALGTAFGACDDPRADETLDVAVDGVTDALDAASHDGDLSETLDASDLDDLDDLVDGFVAAAVGLDMRPPNPTCVAPDLADGMPALLSETGCVDPFQPAIPVPGMIPFGVQAPLWSDAAEKGRWFAIPDGETIDLGPDGSWVFPVGSVLLKTFAYDEEVFETRLIVHHPSDAGPEWRGYSYEWRGDDAHRLDERLSVRLANGVDWLFPSGEDCLACHNEEAAFVIGPETAQLNGEYGYVETGRRANQLTTLDALGFFSRPIGDPTLLRRLVDPDDAEARLDDRARAYLHANCAHCHRPGTWLPTTFDLRHNIQLSETGVCGASAQEGSLGFANPRLLIPGDAAESILLERMIRVDENRMPPLGTGVEDEESTWLIQRWILSLESCD